MKFKITLLLLTLAMFSGPVFADHKHYRGSYAAGYDGRNYDDRYRDNRNYGNKLSRHRDYSSRTHGYRSQRNNHQPSYRRLMNFSPDQFARWYANTAIAQLEEARYSGCHLHNGKGRWTSNWNDHYRHGRKARRNVSISEVETRDRELRRCNRFAHRRYAR